MLVFLIFLFFFLVYCNIMIFCSGNAVFSVFYLIFVYILAAVLLSISFFDFFGYIYIIVYVGALFVLFLFIVMLSTQIESNFIIVYNGLLDVVSLFIFSIIFSFLLFGFEFDIYLFDGVDFLIWVDWSNFDWGFFLMLGDLLYADFFFVTIGCVILLFLGSIFPVLMLLGNRGSYIRNQNINKQISRTNKLVFFRLK